MCGIVAYIGEKQAYDIVVKGLKRLEYRGYDSAGVALLNGDMRIYKKQGKVSNLEAFTEGKNRSGAVGIGHTRWATHGLPNDINAHPHYSADGDLALIHNGIIENYDVIKRELISEGYSFRSETDTEVLVHLVDHIAKKEGVWFGEALRIALNHVVGAYAIVAISKQFPNRMVAARKSSPLVVGMGEDGDFFVASDATPIVEYTKDVVYLDDEEIAVIDLEEGFKLYNIKDQPQTPYIQKLELELEALEKGGYEHFMLKEIHEQPRSIHDCFRGRLNATDGWVSLGGVRAYEQKMIQANRLIFVACGTSWHAGLVGEYLIEELARINVEVEYASEFRYRNPILTENDVVIAISQSGETADTLAAIDLAKSKGATVLGICNVVGSSISRATHGGSYTHAGPEIGVASTKAFTAQVTVFTLIALWLGRAKGTLAEKRYLDLCQELAGIPEKIASMLQSDAQTVAIAKKIKDSTNALYLGRGYNFPVALEGALKLKEISYIHAEGYPAAEMKHGPIALIDDQMPVIVIAPKSGHYDKIVSNVQEVLARTGQIIAIVDEDDTEIRSMAKDTIGIPPSSECLSPLLTTIPLQLLSYHVAVLRGCNVDQPRNLAKSVTVE